MDKLTNWKARRSGPTMTITAKTADGADIRVSDIDLIQAEDNGTIVAYRTDGSLYELVTTTA